MNDPTQVSELELERALDAQLSRALLPPQLPPQFRGKLQAALVRAGDSGLSDTRSRLEREQRSSLESLEQDYVRLRRRTLGSMIGGAFAAGAAAAIALPWAAAHIGPIAPLVIASSGAMLGLGIGLAAWMRSRAEVEARPQP